MTSFSAAATRDRDTSTVRIAGDLDFLTVPELRTAALAALDDPGCRVLVLDLAELEFLDSTGVGCWIEIRRHAAAHDQQVFLRAVPEFARRVLEIGALTKLFPEAPDCDGPDATEPTA